MPGQLELLQQIFHRRPPCHLTRRIIPMLPGILVAFGCARSLAAMKPASTVLHLAVLAQFPDRLEWAPHRGLWCMGNGLFMG